MPEPRVRRDRTAIKRYSLSRPLQLALDTQLISEGSSVFDYGCGRGDDIRLLRKRGYEASGWDPAHRGAAERVDADFVNLGYVLNVIEEPAERAETLQDAWKLTQSALLVSVRLYTEVRNGKFREFRDGYLSERGTFQKFYTQAELRNWANQQLGIDSVSLAPGIIAAFKDDSLKHSFLASRFRTPARAQPARRSDELFDDHQELLEPLMQFFREHGRLPVDGELDVVPDLAAGFGTVKRAFSIVRTVTGKEEWEGVAKKRKYDLLVFLALDRFGGRPRLSALPLRLQADVKAFFGAYSRACKAADKLLYATGSTEAVDRACREAAVGKLTRDALYVHTSALPYLPPILRVYEGCARAFIGEVEGANIVKLRRSQPQVSYLDYPRFDKDPHPALRTSLLVRLDDLSASLIGYQDNGNPPVLHRKELLVARDYDAWRKFARLTRQEERWGLLDTASQIGRQQDWVQLLERKGVEFRGHRLVRKHD